MRARNNERRPASDDLRTAGGVRSVPRNELLASSNDRHTPNFEQLGVVRVLRTTGSETRSGLNVLLFAFSVCANGCRDPATIRLRVRSPEEVVLVGEGQLSEHEHSVVLSRPRADYEPEVTATRRGLDIIVQFNHPSVRFGERRVFGMDDGFFVETGEVILRGRPQAGEPMRSSQGVSGLHSCVFPNWLAWREDCIRTLLAWRGDDTAGAAFRVTADDEYRFYAWTSRANVVSISRHEPVNRAWGWFFLGIGLAAGVGFEAVARADDRDFNTGDVLAIVWSAPLVALGVAQLVIPARTHELYP